MGVCVIGCGYRSIILIILQQLFCGFTSVRKITISRPKQLEAEAKGVQGQRCLSLRGFWGKRWAARTPSLLLIAVNVKNGKLCVVSQLRSSSCPTSWCVRATCSYGSHCSLAMACWCASTAWSGMHAGDALPPAYVSVSQCLSVSLCSLVMFVCCWLCHWALSGFLFSLLQCVLLALLSSRPAVINIYCIFR